MEPILYEFYQHMKNGKILGLCCKKCKTIAFPPRGLCRHCGNAESEWIPLSKKCNIVSVAAGYSAFFSSSPFILATVEIPEGTYFAVPLYDEFFSFSDNPDCIWEYYDSVVGKNGELFIGQNPAGAPMIAVRLCTCQV